MLRKILKITLIVLVSIFAVFGIFVLVVSHNTAFYRAVYPGIDDSMSDYPYMDVTVPSDFVASTVHGITVKAPADCVNPSESGSVPFKNDKLTVMVMSSSDDSSFKDDTPELFSDDDLKHFYDKLGREKPDTSVGDIVFLRDEFNAESCKGLHGKDLLVFNYMAFSKKTVVNVETPYYYHGKNFDGVVCEVGGFTGKITNVMISNQDARYTATVFISCSDADLKHQIIAGIDPSSFLAGEVY